jgi:predicted Zn-dependent peptidase
VKHFQTHFVGDRMVVGVAGGVPHKTAVELSEKAFGGLRKDAGDVTGEDKPLLTGSLI